MKRRAFVKSGIAIAVAGAFLSRQPMFAFGKALLNPNKVKFVSPASMGINLAAISYWGSELPFTDIFKSAGEWVSNAKAMQWGSGPKLDIDEHGWVKRLDAAGFATKMVALAGLYPTGIYTILFDGEGEVQLAFNVGKVIKALPGKLVVKVNSASMPLAVNLNKTNPKNYVRNIRVYLPEYQSSEGVTYTNEFIDRWAGMACIRFMDFIATNNSKIQHWSDRPMLEDASYSLKGVPLELMVDLANKLDADAWFCIPHLADDDYVEKYITYIDQHLKPGLRAWIEYSNEVWNSVFNQSKYCVDIGVKTALAQSPRDAGLLAYARRCRDIFKIVAKVSDNKKRYVCVVASQAANPYVSEKILSFEDLVEYADALAIAPYFSFNVAPNDVLNDKEVMNWSLDKLFEYLETVKLPEAKKWIEDSKKVSERYGLSLVAYEAGQHLTAYRGAENNTQLVDLFSKANAHPRMGKLYSRYLKDWEQSGGGLLCAFSSMSVWSKWGSWGLLERPTDNPEQSAKFKSVVEWAQSHGQSIKLKK
ncbi:hypothetical protein [Methylophilus aquaticus]|uniref:Cellulose-binding protein n=1 Tax=Methylophilus aquaticus TaxID=1971610 RepID=A0ABT9JT68_9PROT|nr:hypothetical protein [Methylophilus aquaticus]MDP8567758.1 hypothetical protein [Methylophilus aquaticus]